MHHLFDEFDEDWKVKGLTYQVLDIFVELIMIALVAFWTIFYIRDAPPIFHVSSHMDRFVDSYISGIFFSLSIFLFFEDLNSKIKYLYRKAVDPVVKKHFPTKGSIVDGSLTYESRKTDK